MLRAAGKACGATPGCTPRQVKTFGTAGGGRGVVNGDRSSARQIRLCDNHGAGTRQAVSRTNRIGYNRRFDETWPHSSCTAAWPDRPGSSGAGGDRRTTPRDFALGEGGGACWPRRRSATDAALLRDTCSPDRPRELKEHRRGRRGSHITTVPLPGSRTSPATSPKADAGRTRDRMPEDPGHPYTRSSKQQPQVKKNQPHPIHSPNKQTPPPHPHHPPQTHGEWSETPSAPLRPIGRPRRILMTTTHQAGPRIRGQSHAAAYAGWPSSTYRLYLSAALTGRCCRRRARERAPARTMLCSWAPSSLIGRHGGASTIPPGYRDGSDAQTTGRRARRRLAPQAAVAGTLTPAKAAPCSLDRAGAARWLA